MDPAEERRRIRAARAYAGFSLDELAARVEMGRSTLIRIDNGERNAKRMELVAIADVCGLPTEFFTADFDKLEQLAAARQAEELAGSRFHLRRLEKLVTAIARQVGVDPDPLEEAEAAIEEAEEIAVEHHAGARTRGAT